MIFTTIEDSLSTVLNCWMDKFKSKTQLPNFCQVAIFCHLFSWKISDKFSVSILDLTCLDPRGVGGQRDSEIQNAGDFCTYYSPFCTFGRVSDASSKDLIISNAFVTDKTTSPNPLRRNGSQNSFKPTEREEIFADLVSHSVSIGGPHLYFSSNQQQKECQSYS